MPASTSLRSVRVRIDTSAVDVVWLEGELVRRGARDAHANGYGELTIVVAAGSAAEAAARARRLLGYAACALPFERRRTNQTMTKATTPTARIAKAIQPQSVVSSG